MFCSNGAPLKFNVFFVSYSPAPEVYCSYVQKRQLTDTEKRRAALLAGLNFPSNSLHQEMQKLTGKMVTKQDIRNIAKKKKLPKEVSCNCHSQHHVLFFSRKERFIFMFFNVNRRQVSYLEERLKTDIRQFCVPPHRDRAGEDYNYKYDASLNQSNYTDTYPTSREWALGAAIEPRTP